MPSTKSAILMGLISSATALASCKPIRIKMLTQRRRGAERSAGKGEDLFSSAPWRLSVRNSDRMSAQSSEIKLVDVFFCKCEWLAQQDVVAGDFNFPQPAGRKRRI